MGRSDGPLERIRKGLDLTVVAEVVSDYSGTADSIRSVGSDGFSAEPSIISRGRGCQQSPNDSAAGAASSRSLIAGAARRNLTGPIAMEEGYVATYIITLDGDVLRIGFGAPANNDVIVRDVAKRLDEMCDGGELQGWSTDQSRWPCVVACSHGPG